MSDVSLIDGHIDDNKKDPCLGCTERHYNCHASCERHHRQIEMKRKETAAAKSAISQERELDRYETMAFARRGKFVKR